MNPKPIDFGGILAGLGIIVALVIGFIIDSNGLGPLRYTSSLQTALAALVLIFAIWAWQRPKH